jgi:hypothetical protein
MSVKRDDRVRVITKNSMHEGKEGVVRTVYEGGEVLVNFDGETYATLTGFFERELEVIEFPSVAEQVRAIAGAL